MKQKYAGYKLLRSLIVVFLMPFSISISQEHEVSLEKLVKDSEVVVTGKVKKIECEIDHNKNIWTYVTIECKQFLKGAKKNIITIKVPGGEIGELGQYVSGTPQYKIGEEVLNFLGRDKEGKYYVNGWENGKYSYKNGKWVKKNSVFTEQFIETVKAIIEKEPK